MNNKKKNYYDTLIDLATIFRNSDNKKKISIIGDLLLLVVITCVIKIPFILIRQLGDNVIDVSFNSSITFLSIWGLLIEIVYTITALYFFIRTIKKWAKNMK